MALMGDYSFSSPLIYIERFFASAFSQDQRAKSGYLKRWFEETAAFLKNTAVFPLGQAFHPVYLAAAYLKWTKENMMC